MATPTPRPSAPPTRTLLSPRVRRLARDHGVDLTHVSTTGPGGRLTAADVTAHLAQQAPSPDPVPGAASALAMTEVDLHRVASEAPGPDATAGTGITAHLCIAVAAALRTHPLPGIAATDGLVVQTQQPDGRVRAVLLRDLDGHSAESVADMLTRPTASGGRSGFLLRCTPSDPVLTVCDLVPGQSAALSVGPVVRKVVVVGGPQAEGMGVHPVATLALRVRLEGTGVEAAAAFLGAVRSALEQPSAQEA